MGSTPELADANAISKTFSGCPVTILMAHAILMAVISAVLGIILTAMITWVAGIILIRS